MVLSGRNGKRVYPSSAFRLFRRRKTGRGPRLADDLAPSTFYFYLYGYVLATLRPAKMSWLYVLGNGKLDSVDFLDSLIKNKGFDTVDFYRLSAGRTGMETKSILRREHLRMRTWIASS